jgi:hypothetical protein
VKLTPSLSFVTLSQEQPVESLLDPFVVISWFLREIFEFLGGINSPRTGVSDSPTGFFLFSRYFHLILDLLAP